MNTAMQYQSATGSINPATTRVLPKHLDTFYDEKYQAMWYYMQAKPRPCFTPHLLQEIRQFQVTMAERTRTGLAQPANYLILASKIKGIFNLGGDLNLFRNLIVQRDRAGLLKYAKACIDVLYPNAVGLDCGLTTISLAQGDALGGGFEAAMSSHVLIAERSSKLGLPEVLFNLFPGMGAYSFLSRRLGETRAERMILSGKLYTAPELYEMGVVDVLAEDGQGELAVYKYIKEETRRSNAHRALRAAKRHCNPVTYEELMGIAEVWVDAALSLEPRDLKMMERLVAKQTGRSAVTA